MARRAPNKQPGEKSSLGFDVRRRTLDKLATLRDAVITATVTFPHDPLDVIKMLYDDEARVILRAAVPYAAAAYRPTFMLTPQVSIHIEAQAFADNQMVSPAGGHVLEVVAATPLLTAINQAAVVIDNFAAVKAVVEWLDRNASLNAIRHYFPAMLSLAPEGHRLPYELSDRFVEPVGIGKYVPLIREAATHVAAALVVPDPVKIENSQMTLYFIGGTTFYRHGITVERASVYIKL